MRKRNWTGEYTILQVLKTIQSIQCLKKVENQKC